jgi:hypothetical protein
MNRCPNCAAQNREGAKFCTSCGFRLPVESAPLITSERSPFATTSTVPPFEETSLESVENSHAEPGFSTWNTPPAEEPAPGLSWDAGPPQNTSVPVNDDMIASLVADTDQPTSEEQTNSVESPASTEAGPPAERRASGESPTVDHLLKLVRDLEYGLIELADAAPARGSGDSRLLANALADLQDEDDLVPLRNAVATAQERPRDVDVMLDLVLRADAISSLLTERDQLKSAIMLYLADESGHGDSADSADASSDDDHASNDEVDGEPEHADFQSDESGNDESPVI